METEHSRQKVFSRRVVLLGGSQLALFGLLAGRLSWVQVVESDAYRMLAEDNRINLRLIAPPRGRIFDRFGTVLAANRQNFRVLLVPEQTRDVRATLAAVDEIVPIPDRQYERVLRDIGRRRSFVPVTVHENLAWNEFAAINVHIPELPGIQTGVGETRNYPFGAALAHVVGYVGAVAEEELTEDPLLQLPGFRIGKSGVEKVHDLALRGQSGNSRVEVNAYGRVIRELARNDGDPGNDVVLTLDMALQQYAYNRLAGESASVVVMDVWTGDVLALVSTPGFDPNDFNIGLTPAAWRALLDNPRGPLLNKPIAGQYPPGSTFKVVVALAALETGAITADHEVYCGGYINFGNRRFHCWREHGHGRLGVVDALARSCDVFFYDVARRTGIDRIAEVARRLGLGEAYGFDLPGERPGLVPTAEWKYATYGVPWQKGETLNAGIGQGYLLATPLQLAVMTARIANGGLGVRPRLVRGVGEGIVAGAEVPFRRAAGEGRGDIFAPIGLTPESLALVQDGMNSVTNDRRGTAFGARLTDKLGAMAGKTGTSQVRRITRTEREAGLRKNEDLPWKLRDHALFVAYAPVAEPRYAVSVVIDHGGSGSGAAAPVARDVLAEAVRLDPANRRPVAPGPEGRGSVAEFDRRRDGGHG